MDFYGTPPVRPLHTAGTEIEFVDQHQYLGIWLDAQLSLKTHVALLEKRVSARTNILRTLTSYSSGATHKVKRMFYTHAIRSLIDYSAPCLIIASQHHIQKLEVLQNQSLRLILSAPRWTKVLNMRAECQLTSIQNRITTLAASHIAKMAHSPRQTTPPDKALYAAERDPWLFTKRTWAREAAAALTKANITRTIRDKGKEAYHPGFSPPPPWRPPLPNIQESWLQLPKSAYNPHVLRAESLNHIGPLIGAHERSLYTDGSVDQITGAAGATLVCEG